MEELAYFYVNINKNIELLREMCCSTLQRAKRASLRVDIHFDVKLLMTFMMNYGCNCNVDRIRTMNRTFIYRRDFHLTVTPIGCVSWSISIYGKWYRTPMFRDDTFMGDMFTSGQENFFAWGKKQILLYFSLTK